MIPHTSLGITAALIFASSNASASLQVPSPRSHAPNLSVAYTLRIDPTHLDVIEVAIRFNGAPASFHLAMKVHAEYDARYWQYLDGMRVTGARNDAAPSVTRQDSTLWRIALPGGNGVVRYRVHVHSPPSDTRRAWMPYLRADGAFINSPDFFLYIPEFPKAPATVDLDIPRDWHVVTALTARGGTTHRWAPDAITLLDAPILLGALREWNFAEGGTTFHVAYWPLPDAVPFDTLALVDAVHRLTRAALDIFGRVPAGADYWFLFQDGAGDALEHGASVTIGLASAHLAADWHSLLPEIAHEFFHTWNLVAIHPAGYNDLSYKSPARNPGLWAGEGLTIHYSDVLLRRTGLADTTGTRFDHVAILLESYYGSATARRIGPERTSLAFGDSPVDNPDATGGYYLQGELLANAIDALVRDSTHDRRGLDDVMRALFAASRHPGYRGYTSASLESTVDSVCGCQAATFFETQVRGNGSIDLRPALARLGKEMLVDSVPATDAQGQPAPDRRMGIDFGAAPGVVRVLVTNPATPWAIAGLGTGDVITAFNGAAVNTIRDLQNGMSRLRVGDQVPIAVRRGGTPLTITVSMTGYARTRVRIVDAPNVTAEQRGRREAWLRGY